MHAKVLAPALVLTAILFTNIAAAERVSVNSKGRDARGDSGTPVVSADGRFVAFATTAKLDPKDKNGITDVYVRDRKTNRTQIVSDSIGGDQPTISANGRFVAFRSFEYYDGLPRIRMVDLERPGQSFSGGVQNLNSYYQPADMPVLNPNGRFLAFAFRPAPNRTDSSFRDHEITVVDLVTRLAYAVLGVNTGENGIPDLGRYAMTADAKTFVFETTAALTVDDTNNVSDIYLVRRPLVGTPGPEQDSPTVYIRLSRPAPNGTGNARSYDPVISLDGTVAFFLSDAPLSDADEDERATVYAVNVSGTPTNLRPISTVAVPIALAREATISGKHLAILGQRPKDNTPRPFILNLEEGTERSLANGGNGGSEAPVLSGDDRVVVYASAASNLAPGDRNRSFDVFAEIPPNAPSARSAPEVVLTQPSDGDRPLRDQAFNVSSTATDEGGAIRMHTFEFNGIPGALFATPGLNTPFTPNVAGLVTAESRAFNDAWIEGRSEVVNLTVREPSVTFAIAGIEQLERVDNEDGSTTFDLTLALENRGNVASPPLTMLITAASTPFTTNSSVNLDDIDRQEEQVIAVIDVPMLAALERRSIQARGVTPPTENIGNAEQGLGWTVLARLRSAGTLHNTVTVFQATPRLTENTFLPNGGLPTGGTPNTETQFNPALLQELQIQGRSEVAAGARAKYAARAVFSTGVKACAPAWSVKGPSGVRITPDGTLNAGNLSSAATVTVRADFAGTTATQKVKIRPVSPKISIRAETDAITEGGESGSFRITRTPVSSQDLTVQYRIAGSATSGQDYSALSGTAVIPGGASSATLDINSIQDANAEGEESVELTVLPDSAYRLRSRTAASLRLIDDEPFPAGQPDGVLQYGDQPPIGANVIDAEYGPVSGIETSQHLEIRGRKDRTERFTLSMVNRDATARVFTVTGAASALGFNVQYLAGEADITAAIIAGTHSVPLTGGESADITVEITPSKDASIGTWINCELVVRSAMRADKLAIELERVR
jgi:hypothetical protein